MAQPHVTRPIFAPEDFALLRDAVLHYLREEHERPVSTKLANLYHRLGRLG